MQRGLCKAFVVASVLAVGACRGAAAAPATIVAYSTQPDSITVGDPVTLEVRVRAAAGARVTFPRAVPPDPRVQVEELQVLPPVTMPDSMTGWIGRYSLTVFDVGQIVLRPWPVQVATDTSNATVFTDSIRIDVASVVPDSLAQADIRDLKTQRQIDVPWPRWVWFALAALALLVALLVAWLVRRRRRPQVVVVAPPKPASEVALARLRGLETDRLPAQGMIKEHYVRLSEILRAYLEDAPQFGVPALEQTTDEIRAGLMERDFPPDVVGRVRVLCEEADLVKFAKHQPTLAECTRALERVRDFVLETARKPALQEIPALEPAVGGNAA
jgi:hypothetical protein